MWIAERSRSKNRVKVAAVIPARMASSRFPGKPLVEIRGLPMIEHVRRRALLCGKFTEVVVATCDEEISRAVGQAGGRVIMTSAGHPAATDRVAEAAQQLDCTHVMNIQGDEILVLPEDLERMVSAIQELPDLEYWNAVARIEEKSELGNHSIVKCTVSRSERILYCSRDFSSLMRLEKQRYDPVRKVLGILGFRKDALQKYIRLDRTPLETSESLDQSRVLEHDLPLQGVLFHRGYIGINQPEEVELVQACMDQDPRQRTILQELSV